MEEREENWEADTDAAGRENDEPAVIRPLRHQAGLPRRDRGGKHREPFPGNADQHRQGTRAVRRGTGGGNGPGGQPLQQGGDPAEGFLPEQRLS